jgi:hypothetical protein
MGLSFAFLAYSNGGAVDLRQAAGVEAAHVVVRRLYPRTPYELVGPLPLLETNRLPRGEIAVGVFGDGVLIATRDAHLYDPDILRRRYLKLDEWTDVQLMTSASVNNMFAYGHWQSGRMTRCLSVNARAGVWRDEGVPEAFEAGHGASVERWLDLSNAALASVLRLDGDAGPPVSDPVPWEDLQLHHFVRQVG